MKDINEMTDHEILVELLEEKRRNDRNRIIKYVLYGIVALVIIILLSIYVPKIMAWVDRYNKFMNEIETTTNSVKEFVDGVGTSTTQKIDEVLDGINAFLKFFRIGN